MGALLYYARAVNSTILTALISLATEQAKPTQKSMEKVKQLLDYCTSQKEAIIMYNASNMILAIHSNVEYCNKKKSRSWARVHFFLSNKDNPPPNNGAIFTDATIIKAKLSTLYLNAKEVVCLPQIIIEMGHLQPQTPIQTDNMMVEGVTNSTIQPKLTKAMDAQFRWLRDHESQDQFKIYWWPEKPNLADYFTKHHPPNHHTNVRADFLTKVKYLAESRWHIRSSTMSLTTLILCQIVLIYICFRDF